MNLLYFSLTIVYNLFAFLNFFLDWYLNSHCINNYNLSFCLYVFDNFKIPLNLLFFIQMLSSKINSIFFTLYNIRSFFSILHSLKQTVFLYKINFFNASPSSLLNNFFYLLYNCCKTFATILPIIQGKIS